MLGQPSGSSHPIHDHRHHLVRRGYARRRPGRHVNTAAAVQVSGIGPVNIHSLVIVVKERLMVLCQISRETVPIDHLRIFIGHIVAPDQIVAAAPEPIQGKGVGVLISSGDCSPAKAWAIRSSLSVS